jgi:uncharacterized 2Fe-2S/4Fe-4S cluster protein (DUF4445 family)
VAQEPVGSQAPTGGQAAKGLAIDLGTTHIRVALWDMGCGKRLAGRSGLNRQYEFGADVVTRIIAARESPDDARHLSELALESIGQAVFDIVSRDGFNPREVAKVSLVGNTAELALLSQKNYELLLQPRFWEQQIDCQPEDTRRWSACWNIHPEAAVEVVPPLGGFVGSDLLADVLATEMTARAAPSLLIDFGTNAEIALWDGASLWVTSAAGGPAFEGVGLSCWIPAEPGAIYRIEPNCFPSDFAFEVLSGGSPRGLCGSGLIDLIAGLVRSGLLSKKGRFTGPRAEEGFALGQARPQLRLTPRDVDIFQRAKAAIGAGVACLLHLAGQDPLNLRRIYVCGAFGRFLSVENALAIGLLPAIEGNRIELCGQAALAGCEQHLLSPAHRRQMEAVRRQVRMVNLAQYPGFDDFFLENLFLQPMGGG